MVVGNLCSCSNDVEDEKDELVVEGWICQNDHPIVLIHKSYAVNNSEHNNPDAELEDVIEGQLIPWGRVTIHDGNKEVVLTGRIDTLFTPPFVYTTTDILGQVGQNYRIQVDYKNYHATAATTILEPVALDSIVVQLVAASQTSHVTAYLSHLPPDSYYLVEYKEISEHQFHICPLGTASSAQAMNGVLSINVLSIDNTVSAMTSALHHFVTDDKEYVLRLLRIDREQYDYFTALCSQLASQGIFFMSAYRNLPSNLNGGIGYWAGWGKNDYHFFINQNKTFSY